VDIRRVKDGGVAAYAAKLAGYLGKWLGSGKMVTFSRDYKEKYEAPAWITVESFARDPVFGAVEAYLDDGTVIERSCQACEIGIKGDPKWRTHPQRRI